MRRTQALSKEVQLEITPFSPILVAPDLFVRQSRWRFVVLLGRCARRSQRALAQKAQDRGGRAKETQTVKKRPAGRLGIGLHNAPPGLEKAELAQFGET